MTSQIHGIAIPIKGLAEHWVGVDDDHLRQLKELCTKVDPQIKGLTEKNKTRLRQSDDLRNVALLLHFPRKRIDEVLKNDQGRQRDAVAVQIALGIRADIDEVFFHCAKAIKRSKLWDPSLAIERNDFPTYGQIIRDQRMPEKSAEEVEAAIQDNYGTQMY